MHELVESDPETGRHWATYKYPSHPPSITILHALTEVSNRSTTDFDPLYNSIVDPDALDDLFCPERNPVDHDCQVTFTYHGYRITVKNYGRIVIREPVAQQNHSSF